MYQDEELDYFKYINGLSEWNRLDDLERLIFNSSVAGESEFLNWTYWLMLVYSVNSSLIMQKAIKDILDMIAKKYPEYIDWEIAGGLGTIMLGNGSTSTAGSDDPMTECPSVPLVSEITTKEV